MGAGTKTSRGLSHLTSISATYGFTSRVGTSLGGTHTLWPADDQYGMKVN
jgi:hypothetical protein